MTDERFRDDGAKGPLPGAPCTSVTIIEFPDGDIQVSGAHLGYKQLRPRPPATEEEKDKKAEDRARRKIAAACKYHEVDRLWTLTYRGKMDDRARLWHDLDLFERKVRQDIPDFALIGVPELHPGDGVNAGGWHFHFGTAGYVDINILNKAWWSVTGSTDTQKMGNVDIKPPRSYDSSRGIGSYLAKYVSKELGGWARYKGEHRYWISRKFTVPVTKRKIYSTNPFYVEALIKTWISTVSKRSVSFEWHSDDQAQFLFRTG